ncbi:heme-binding peroxidase [Metarhizium album ARSEF 1941]|uniref:Heme-binding peroxidase n=1 Tax=Metarhizium album (strain ARSEF 1941) TaxID=1081103 RepID=A0A0B2WN82_METAS|nr:heme-binding peroxidase [Metarhizium album ARSEF 1941]KHN97521.1 heme-binding peroxidase [Metarhizium album ARSEF 1941]
MADTDLPSKIKLVIREVHGKVNRLNTARIPLCLPPRAESPALYTLGLSRYAEIYRGLEEVWHAQIGDGAECMGDISNEPSSYGTDKERIQAVLRMIYLPELLRTKRLQADFAALKQLHRAAASVDTTRGNAGTEFRRYIEDYIPTKPHLLVVYAWIMYQALFNGGRFIRKQLVKAGPEFWGLSAAEMDPSAALPPPLSFWRVEEEASVEARFRDRVVTAGKLLTERERLEIYDEALEIFRRCQLITIQLDEDAKVGGGW